MLLPRGGEGRAPFRGHRRRDDVQILAMKPDDAARVIEVDVDVDRAREALLGRVEVPRRRFGEVAAMHASDGIAAWHWWTLAAMDTTDEVIWPSGLAVLVRAWIR